MKALLLQLVALGSSLVLALPPGWCGCVTQRGDAQREPARDACCHRPAGGQPRGSGHAPVCPGVQCCSRDATVPEKSVQPDETPRSVLSPATDHLPLNARFLTPGAVALEP